MYFLSCFCVVLCSVCEVKRVHVIRQHGEREKEGRAYFFFFFFFSSLGNLFHAEPRYECAKKCRRKEGEKKNDVGFANV